jgi:folate-binding protein YgfZ
VQVSGPDAVSYLQGQASQDVEDLDVGATSWTFVLQPTGKVDAWARVTRTAGDTFILDVDGGGGPALAARLQRFLLRTKAEVTELDWRCVALRGPGAVEAAQKAAKAGTDPTLGVPAGWPGIEGACLLGPDVTIPAGVDEVPLDAIEAARITAGVPAWGAEVTDRTIPAELGRWVIDAGVDFTKGCFTGQELVARIDSRGGNVPRQLRGLVVDPDSIEDDDLPKPGTPIEAGGATVGEVTSSAWSPALDRVVALAFISRAALSETTARVGDRRAQIRQLPLV